MSFWVVFFERIHEYIYIYITSGKQFWAVSVCFCILLVEHIHPLRFEEKHRTPRAARWHGLVGDDSPKSPTSVILKKIHASHGYLKIITLAPNPPIHRDVSTFLLTPMCPFHARRTTTSKPPPARSTASAARSISNAATPSGVSCRGGGRSRGGRNRGVA